MISSGRTRWVATVMKAADTIDSYGRRTATYSTGTTIRVDVRELGGGEQAYAQGVAVVQQYEIRTRWPNVARASLTTLDRLVVRGKTMRIDSIRNSDERDRLAIIDCSEVA